MVSFISVNKMAFVERSDYSNPPFISKPLSPQQDLTFVLNILVADSLTCFFKTI